MCCDVQFTDYQCKLTAGCRAEPAKVGINTTIAFQAIVLDEMNNRLPTLVSIFSTAFWFLVSYRLLVCITVGNEMAGNAVFIIEHHYVHPHALIPMMLLVACSMYTMSYTTVP